MDLSINQLESILTYIKRVDSTKKPVLFKDYAKYWLDTYCRGKVKDNTFDGNYRVPVEVHLIPYFGDKCVSEIKPNDVQEFFNIKSSTSALESQKKMRACIKGIFETAVDNELCYRNPVTSTLRLQSDIPPVVKYTWSQEDYNKAWNFAKTHQYGLDVMVLMETAISRSELLGLTWKDHDSKNRILYIRQGLVVQRNSSSGKRELVVSGLKNKYRSRSIPISAELNAALALQPRRIYLNGNKKKGIPIREVRPKHIFYSPEGLKYSPENWSNRVIKNFMKDLTECYPEIRPLRAHELRHTRATLLKNQETDVFSIARLLGHCDLDMLVKRYAHDDVEALRNSLNIDHHNQTEN